ncbi:MAG: glutamyl-tRNA reductase [bacterium]|nr:glutamyl-tRNA reductase [bacterium]
MKEILLVGINHKSAPVEIRERISFPKDSLITGLNRLREYETIKGCVILSTCNRVEMYVSTNDIERATKEIKEFLADYHKLEENGLDEYLYIMKGEIAIEHLLKVPSSLDSLVIGEPQVLCQFKDAYNQALRLKVTDSTLNTLFQKAINIAKRVREESHISKGAVSISFVAVELAKEFFRDLKKRKALLIGAGKMSELAAKHLIENGIKMIYISNRTYEKAVELAKEFNGQAIPFDETFRFMKDTDIVISSTFASSIIIKSEDVSRVMEARDYQPIILIDIAFPRDIDPDVGLIDGVYLYDIDDLKMVVEKKTRERSKEIKTAEKILSEELRKVLSWYRSLDIVPTILSLRDKMEYIRKGALNKVINKLKSVTPEDRERIDYLTRIIVNKIIASPISQLKKRAETDNGHIYKETFQDLFRLKE